MFTLTKGYLPNQREKDQYIIDTLHRCYQEIYFWPQGIEDEDYFLGLANTEDIKMLGASKQAYDDYLTNNDTDYVGTRLHGGVYAMRHRRRAIIIAIDERARAINEKNHLNCIDFNQLEQLEEMIESEFSTEIVMDYNFIKKWKKQFEL